MARRGAAVLRSGRSRAMAVGVALLLSGAGTYVYLVLAARALGPHRYSALSALWSLVILVSPGVFIPVEQEVARAVAARRARGEGSAPVAAKALRVVAALVAAFGLASVAAAPLYLEPVLDGSGWLLVGLVLAVPAYACQFLLRGVLAGAGRLTEYAVLVGAEGVCRAVAAGALFWAGAKHAGPYGLLIGSTVLPGCLLLAPRAARALLPGPPAAWRELTSALGLLLAGSVMAQALVNVGPLLVKVLADEAEEAATGRFLAALVLARIPLFLFQAVQAAVLPKLATLVADGRVREFRVLLSRMASLVAAVTVAGAAAAYVAGPTVSRVVFGPGFALGRRDFALLVLGNGAFLLAQALAQGVVALQSYRRVAWAWTAGVMASAVAVGTGEDVVLRVEVALVVGSLVTVAVLFRAVFDGLRRLGAASDQPVH